MRQKLLRDVNEVDGETLKINQAVEREIRGAGINRGCQFERNVLGRLLQHVLQRRGRPERERPLGSEPGGGAHGLLTSLFYFLDFSE